MSNEINILKPSSGPIIPGEWNSNLQAGLQYAKTTHTPLYVIWSAGNGCGNCNETVTNALSKDKFIQWMKYRKIVMIYTEKKEDRSFVQNVPKTITFYPIHKIYWEKDNGEVIQYNKGFINSLQFGSSYTSSADYPNYIDFSERIILWIEQYIGGWCPTGQKDIIVMSIAHEGKGNNKLNGIITDTEIIFDIARRSGIHPSMVFQFRNFKFDNSFKELLKGLSSHDFFVFHYSGYGGVDNDGSQYLSYPSIKDKDFIQSLSPNMKNAFFLFCCSNAGGMIEQEECNKLPGNVIVWSACEKDQTSWNYVPGEVDSEGIIHEKGGNEFIWRINKTYQENKTYSQIWEYVKQQTSHVVDGEEYIQNPQWYTNSDYTNIKFFAPKDINSDTMQFNVEFQNFDSTIVKNEKVEEGKDAIPPQDPVREGYTFTGWKPDYHNVQSDLTCVAQYAKQYDPQKGLHTIKISNNITNLQVIGNSEYQNALQENLVSVEIGSNCTTIGPSCFINCKNLEYVKLPKTCKYIGDYAFYGCENLKYITCLDKNDCYEIFSYGNHAFDGCNSLYDISYKLSSAVSRDATTGEYCFANCKNLRSFTQEGWSYLGSHMFANCESLTSINLKNNTNYVQEYALADIPNLKSINIPSKMWIISEGMFANDKNLSSVNIQDDNDSKSVMMLVGNEAFSGCENLKTIVLPQSINSISCCDDFMLRGSNISSVSFTGISDNQFVSKENANIKLNVDGYITDGKIINKAIQSALDNNVPIILFTNKKDYNIEYQQCGACETLAKHLRSKMWKQYMKSIQDKCIIVYITFEQFNELCDEITFDYNSSIFVKNGIRLKMYTVKPSGGKGAAYANYALIWKKSNTDIALHVNKGYPMVDFNDTELKNLISTIQDFLKTAQSSSSSKITFSIKQEITKLGSPLSSVTYVSKEGNSHVILRDNVIETIPNTRVDKDTKDNFKYGTWYYNAKELREYADKNGIPVLCEYSKDGCSPCMYFKKNVFKNLDFQNWVMKSPYLFCRIEIGKDENFENEIKYPEPYYIDKIWARQINSNVTKMSIPIFFWYWNKNGITQVGDLSSYHFNPDSTGAKPPFSMQQIMSYTDSKFSTYQYDEKFKRTELYDLYSNSKNPIKIGLYADNVEAISRTMFGVIT